jgi:hypothetical protein
MKRTAAVLAALLLLSVIAGCERDDLVGSPANGAIVPGSTVQVTGTIPDDLPLGGTVEANGVATSVNADRTWSVAIPHAASGYVTPVTVVYTVNGAEYEQRTAVVHGDKIDEGQYSPEGVGMRFTNEGLVGLGPVIESLAGGAFDIGGLLMAQNPIIDQEDAFLTFDITGNVYEAGIGGVTLAPQSTDAGIATPITISDLYVGVNLHITDGLAINTDCGLELQIPTTTIDATFDLEPTAGDESKVDVNLLGAPAVDTGTVGYEFISGICDSDSFLIGDIVNSVAGPKVESMVGEGFATNLGDPDGAGPADSPIADAIETALGEISIAGSVGEAVQAHLDGPFTSIDETASAIDFRANADFYATPGATAADCPVVPGAPDLAATFDVPGSYPSLGATTPGGSPYGLGLVISASAFNQLLGSMTECGILNQTVTEFALGGGAPLPINSTLLSLMVPEFGTALPPNTPMYVKVTPTVAPFLTSSPGPNGEPAELMLANLQIDFVQDTAELGEVSWLTLAVDAPLGFSLAYDAEAGVLAPTITPPPASAVTARVVSNRVGADEPSTEAVFPNLFPMFVGAVGDTFSAFPLPGFLGLQLNVLEVAREGNYFVLYANLDPVPQTRLENVAVTDLSSGDSVTDSIFDVNEWRHRLRPSVSPSQVGVQLKGMLGADACCTTGDEDRSAHAGYRVTFDVVPENGDTWQVDLSHLIRGAHTLIDEKVALEDAGGESRFQTNVTARAQVGGGTWQSFDFAATPGSVVHALRGGEGTTNREFTGSNAMVLTGNTAQTITVEFGFDMYVKSNSNLAFPAAGGDEVALRFGANDTITNGFGAGGYPGLGNRNLLTDGHFAVIQLTTTPAP